MVLRLHIKPLIESGAGRVYLTIGLSSNCDITLAQMKIDLSIWQNCFIYAEMHIVSQIVTSYHTLGVFEVFLLSKWVLDGIEFQCKLCPRIVIYPLLYTSRIFNCKALRLQIFIDWPTKFNHLHVRLKSIYIQNFDTIW